MHIKRRWEAGTNPVGESRDEVRLAYVERIDRHFERAALVNGLVIQAVAHDDEIVFKINHNVLTIEADGGE